MIATAGALAGILFAFLTQGAFNRFFQWRYNTTLVFLRITPTVVWRSLAMAVPLGISGQPHRLLDAPSPAGVGAGPPLVGMRRAFHLLADQRPPTGPIAARILGVAAIGALLFDMLSVARLVAVVRHSRAIRLRRSRGGLRRPPFTGPRLSGATTVAADIAAVPGIAAVLQLRVREAEVVPDSAGRPAGTAADRANEVARSISSVPILA